MRITATAVRDERERILADTDRYVQLVNDTRDTLGHQFDKNVGQIDNAMFTATVSTIFADGDRAVNVAALSHLLRELDVPHYRCSCGRRQTLGRRR